MTYIAVTKAGGRKYFSEMESYREGNKVKKRTVHYFGTTDPRKNPDAKPILKSQEANASYDFGDISLIYHAAQRIDFINCIGNYATKRQGLPLSLELFLTVAHRLLGDRPSSSNLPDWTRDTYLPKLLNFDSSKITGETQAYMMNKLYNQEKNIDHLYRISIDLYNNARKLFGKEENVFFYDITSTYFEGKCCPIAFFGHNKDGKLDKLQINIAMIMNGAYGIPIVSKVFEGNINDAKTLYEMVYYPKVIMRKKKCLLVMDRGFDSEDNVKLMDTTGYDYIIGLRSTHKFVKKLKKETDFTVGDWDTIDNDGSKIKLRKVIKNIAGKRRNVILYYSPKAAADQKRKRDFRIDNAIKRLDNQGKLTIKKAEEIVRRVKKYVVIEDKEGKMAWRIDKVAVNRAERNDGKFCLMTSLGISPKEVFTTYFSKDKIEKGFRCMKQEVNMRPVYKREPDHVIVDSFICHVAYLLLRVVEHLAQKKKIEKSWNVLSSESTNIRLLEYRTSAGRDRFQIVSNTKFQKDIVRKFDLYRYIPVSTT
jgi:transposase